MPSKLKRLPYNSYTIILKFENAEDRDKCIHSEEFQKIYGKLLTKIITNYDCKIGTIIY
ncbi:MAG: hypothetical protein ACTSQJ_18735 [Promethearchaeota archaeon]